MESTPRPSGPDQHMQRDFELATVEAQRVIAKLDQCVKNAGTAALAYGKFAVILPDSNKKAQSQ